MDSEPIVEIQFSSNTSAHPQVYRAYAKEILNFDVNTVADEARESNTSYKYSGRHDHGALPVMKSSGPAAQLCDALLEIKQESDRYLTGEIAKQLKSQPAVEVSAPKKKRTKIELLDEESLQQGPDEGDQEDEEKESTI